MSDQPGAPESSLLEVAGLAAYVRLGLFGLIGEHTWDAPDLASAQRMVAIARRVSEQQDVLLAIGASHGLDAVTLMQPFDGVLDAFEARTPESSWWEGLLKGIVGHGVSSDLCRLLARGLTGPQAAEVADAMRYSDDDDRATAIVRAGVDADGRLGSRLALWGRRVVGESLSLAQELMTTRPAFTALARAAASGAGVEGDAVAWVLGELTAEHTRRMDRMGLAA
ncbi:MAG: ferritin-like domain-containing protein [Promicromonosporaceae bacterium]|nr:ferritin-like domain-containing protein [Promicromonosporaceae bacterium]